MSSHSSTGRINVEPKGIDEAISHLTVDWYPVFRAMFSYTYLLCGLLAYICFGVTLKWLHAQCLLPELPVFLVEVALSRTQNGFPKPAKAASHDT